MKSINSLLNDAKAQKKPLYLIIAEKDCFENGTDLKSLDLQFSNLWKEMKNTAKQYSPAEKSKSGLSGGDAEKIKNSKAKLIGGNFLLRVTEEALKTGECNACMKRIVAAPTAGSCGVLTAVLIPLCEEKEISESLIK